MMTDTRWLTDLPGRCEGEEDAVKYTSFLKVKSCDSMEPNWHPKKSRQSGVFIFGNARREGREWPSVGNKGQSWKGTSQLLAFIPKYLLCVIG